MKIGWKEMANSQIEIIKKAVVDAKDPRDVMPALDDFAAFLADDEAFADDLESPEDDDTEGSVTT